ncbi:MAG: hypothetical protein Fur0032_20730 [Terrimicrobiaceae bacterium]
MNDPLGHSANSGVPNHALEGHAVIPEAAEKNGPFSGAQPKPPPLPDAHKLTRAARFSRAMFLLAGLAFAVLWIGKPLGGIFSGGTCGFHAMTGLPCGLCGATRATRAMLSGDWARAWELNALAFPVLGVVAFAALVLAGEAMFGRRLLPVWPVKLRVVAVLAACVSLLVWTTFQIRTALRETNRELVNFEHPLVKFLERNRKGN